MNREIKFRAWDKKYNQMLYGGEVWERHPNWYSIDFITNKGIVVWNKLGKDAGPSAYENQKIIMNEDIVIMQATGAPDETKTEIFEGDILSDSTRPDRSFKGVVEWYGCGFKVITIPGRNYCLDLSEQMRNPSAHYDTIIGNIYENPELLNSEQEVQECDASKDAQGENAGNQIG